MAEGIKVSVYNSKGELVFSERSQGSEIEWNIGTREGQGVANGVYIYNPEIKLNQEWFEGKISKLLIIR